MASQEVTLRPGDTLTLLVDGGGRVLRLDIQCTEQGVALGSAQPAPQPSPQPLAKPKTAPLPARPQPAPVKPQPAPVVAAPIDTFGLDEEPTMDLPTDDPEPEPSRGGAPMEVADEGSEGLSEGDLDLGDDLGDGGLSLDLPPEDMGDNLRLTNVPGVGRKPTRPPAPALPAEEPDIPTLEDEPIGGDEGFNADALTMVPPARGRAPEGPPSLTAESASLSPIKFHDPKSDVQPSPLSMEEPQQTILSVKPTGGKKDLDSLPPWTGRARDYRDPKVEARKKETGTIQKPIAPPPAAAAPVGRPAPKPGTGKLPPKPGTGKVAQGGKPLAPAPKAAEPELSLEAEEPAVTVPDMPAKPAPGLKKPLPGPAGPKKPTAPVPAGAPATKVPEGNFTVFLSPPKGADKKQAAAEIIAEVQGIDIGQATELAGKMIVPVIKGVTEDEANRVRDLLKNAGLSCRITQKR